MKLIVGLGNPGSEYANTRHNLGWLAVSEAAARCGAEPFKTKKDFKAEISEGRIGDEKVLFVHPLTFMNLSGEAVRAIVTFFKVELTNILIVQDELDYAPGSFAFTAKGGPAGHNGVTSIQETLATTNLNRLRIGIGRPVAPITKEAYVLQPFSKEERTLIDEAVDNATQAILDWVTSGIDKASNTWNGVGGGHIAKSVDA